jgi:hypothetical protein
MWAVRGDPMLRVSPNKKPDEGWNGAQTEVCGTKEKAPAKDRGTVFYGDKSIRIVILLSRPKTV